VTGIVGRHPRALTTEPRRVTVVTMEDNDSSRVACLLTLLATGLERLLQRGQRRQIPHR